jgi:hypothetical protein
MPETTVVAWPLPTGVAAAAPKRIKRPCDWGLDCAVHDLEVQLGTIEAYNRLVEAAEQMRAEIEAGRVKAQNPLYAVSVKG